MYLHVAIGMTSSGAHCQRTPRGRRYNQHTVLLPRPPAGLQTVVAQTERPLGVLTAWTNERQHGVTREGRGTYTLPASVVGGAKRSAF